MLVNDVFIVIYIVCVIIGIRVNNNYIHIPLEKCCMNLVLFTIYKYYSMIYWCYKNRIFPVIGIIICVYISPCLIPHAWVNYSHYNRWFSTNNYKSREVFWKLNFNLESGSGTLTRCDPLPLNYLQLQHWTSNIRFLT